MDGSLTDADCGKLSRQETEAGGRKRLNIRIGNQEIRIGAGIIACLFLSYFVPQIQRLAACTAVVMCTQEISQATLKSGLTRMKGVVCGGAAGIAVVLLDQVIQIEFVFFILCGIGIVLNLLICRLLHMPPVTDRVSAITFCLVVLLAEGNGRIFYAVSRFVGTLAGALTALIITALWRTVEKKCANETE
ncbi:hypothetical protein GCM10008922_19760 [Faecalicatena contorta]|uniref:FUSC family protein n=1 Tax=Faecalicatena contorta TaxID=39482 RepID=UPI0031E27EDE